MMDAEYGLCAGDTTVLRHQSVLPKQRPICCGPRDAAPTLQPHGEASSTSKSNRLGPLGPWKVRSAT